MLELYIVNRKSGRKNHDIFSNHSGIIWAWLEYIHPKSNVYSLILNITLGHYELKLVRTGLDLGSY